MNKPYSLAGGETTMEDFLDAVTMGLFVLVVICVILRLGHL